MFPWRGTGDFAPRARDGESPPFGRRGLVLALTGGVEFSHDDGWFIAPPIFSFSERRKRENGPCTVQKRKRRWGENLPVRANFAQMRGSSQTVPGNLAVSIRLRLTAYRPLALCRSSKYHRGCFASLTQGPLRRFPRFAHTLSRAGRSRGLPGAVSGRLCGLPDSQWLR